MKQNRKTGSLIVGLLLIFIIIAGDLITGAVSSRAPTVIPVVNHDGTQLGTWLNMPPGTSCDLSGINSSNNVSAQVCELLGNSTYRGSVIAQQNIPMAGYFAILSVRCITLSNTIGATLTLQYAIMGGSVNSTNFQSLSSVFIDGSSAPGCTGPNTFGTSTAVGLNVTSANQGYMFRVVGTDGGGPGDNPRFASVNVIVENGLVRIFYPVVTSVTNTQIILSVWTTIRSSVSQAVNLRWSVTNASSTTPGCGGPSTGGTFVCWQAGTATCTIAINAGNCAVTTTYPRAFTGTTQGTASVSTLSQGATVIAGIDSLLSAQTLTV